MSAFCLRFVFVVISKASIPQSELRNWWRHYTGRYRPPISLLYNFVGDGYPAIHIKLRTSFDENKAVLEPCVSPAFAITYFIAILDLKKHQSMWIHWPFFPKTWTKGHWPLDDLWPHVCWGHMCDSTQGSLCPSPMTIHQCMWIQWSILQNTTYIHILHTYTYYIQNEWSHSLLLNIVQARQKV